MVGPGNVSQKSVLVEDKTTESLEIIWDSPGGTVDYYKIQVECTSPNVNSTMKPSSITIVYNTFAAANNLDPGTVCMVTITTFINQTMSRDLEGGTTSKNLTNTTTEAGTKYVTTLF